MVILKNTSLLMQCRSAGESELADEFAPASEKTNAGEYGPWIVQAGKVIGGGDDVQGDDIRQPAHTSVPDSCAMVEAGWRSMG
jgi:hypothetical protein